MGLFGKRQEMTLQVQGMTCGNCVAHVTKALEAVAGVKQAKVSLPDVAVVRGTQLDRAALAAAVGEAGYEVTGPSDPS